MLPQSHPNIQTLPEAETYLLVLTVGGALGALPTREFLHEVNS